MVREIRPVERDDLDELSFDVLAVGRDSAGALDEAPRRPDQSATFEPQRLSRPRRFPVALALWVGVLALFVIAGFLGQESAVSRAPGPADVAVASPAGPLLQTQAPDPIDLLSPEVGPITTTTARLTVKGKVMVKAARVVVSLEARDNRVLDRVTFDTTDPDGGVRPLLQPTFSAAFDVPFPRPNGTMWVVVTAYDWDLTPLGGERRPVLIGEIMGWPAVPGVG